MEQDDEEDFARGREYCDKKAFKLAVMSYVVLIKGCPFAVRGRLTDEGCVRVTSSHLDHSCQPLQHKTPPALIAKAVAATELRNRSSVKAQAYDALQLETQSVDMRGASYRLLKPWLDAMTTANPDSVVDLVSSSDDHVLA
ncbi:hypothetical protein PHYSODRAFT_328092 [Phytophthora sojae]|uniref:Uncharacterized protein n=1 Tax=Phytophthora sojae (strain P6497) TaxID=1094619 RepID=G4ZBK1_PHYSP|nr:hypothetical protein PHYSODRAFT_328092 [Phytophthora sojae]EGZ19923.1 hypothetical protein PHYSODRAFT_328092 [Phytophthora sojae]|eukprot:XP_009522640.1 hypothetical protein PHYSODRAFT_328092 [Phytophthora sojae]